MKTLFYSDTAHEEATADETDACAHENPAPGSLDDARPDPASEEYAAGVDAAPDTMGNSDAENSSGNRVQGGRNDDHAHDALRNRVQAEARPRENDGEIIARTFLEMLERASEGKLLTGDGQATDEQKDAFCKAAGRVLAKRAGAAMPWEEEIVLLGTGIVVLIYPIRKLIERFRNRGDE